MYNVGQLSRPSPSRPACALYIVSLRVAYLGLPKDSYASLTCRTIRRPSCITLPFGLRMKRPRVTSIVAAGSHYNRGAQSATTHFRNFRRNPATLIAE